MESFILFEEIEELTKLIINSKEQKEVLARIVRKVMLQILMRLLIHLDLMLELIHH